MKHSICADCDYDMSFKINCIKYNIDLCSPDVLLFNNLKLCSLYKQKYKSIKINQMKTYRKKQLQQMRPYFPGEVLPSSVSISEADIKAGSPKEGDMIAINPNNKEDMQLINKDFFDANYEEVISCEPKDWSDRLYQEFETVNENYRKLKQFIETFSEYKTKVNPIQQSLHKIQLCTMDAYREILHERILDYEMNNK